MTQLKLQVLKGRFSIHRFAPDSALPDQIHESEFLAITRTTDELSVVCSSAIQLQSGTSSTGWSCLKVPGPLDLDQTGVLAGMSTCLAEAGISIFAISTFDTDYILVRADKLESAEKALVTSGYTVLE